MDNLEDATLAPSPDGGWSQRIVSVKDALVATTTDDGMIQPSGVFDVQGFYVHEAVLWRGRPLMVPPVLPEPVDHLAGRWIWGGILLNHFGHFLTESTGRLWALDAVKGDIDGIVFISKREAEDDGEVVKDYQGLIFDLMGVNVPIRIIAQPTRVDLLEVPGQGFGIGTIAHGTDPFRHFVNARFAKTVAAQGANRLYISRSGLAAIRGGILEETRLETYLAAAGYEIFHPQKHTITEQIAHYKAASDVVALDGSALHLLAMVGCKDQRVAIIKRRDSGATDSIVRHISSFCGRAPVVIDAILQDWIRSDRKRADRMSFGELDFEKLGTALGANGFVPSDTRWTSLSAAESFAAVRDIESKLKRRKLTFQPVPRGSKGKPVAPPGVPRNPRREARMAARLAAKTAQGE